MRKSKLKKRGKMNLFFSVVLVVLILYTVLLFGLFIMGINISLKNYADLKSGNIFGLPNMFWWNLDREFKGNIFGNYLSVFQKFPFKKHNSYIVGLFNKEKVEASIDATILKCSIYTLVYACGGALFATFMPMFMGYLCAMYRNKVSALIYAVVLFVIATPIIGATPATVNLMRSLRLYDTFLGEFLRRSTFTNMYFLLFIAYFKGLSAGYSEAAEIDGASQLSIMFRIYIPLARSMFFTIYLILFVAFWNDFTTPMMFLPSKPTLSYAIYYRITVDTGGGFADPVRQMAILMVFAIPIIVIFTIFNKQLMTNLTMGGMKE